MSDVCYKAVSKAFETFTHNTDEINEVINSEESTQKDVGSKVKSLLNDAVEDSKVKMECLRNLCKEKDYYAGHNKRYERSKKLLEARLKNNLKPYSDLCNAFSFTISVMCLIMIILQAYYAICSVTHTHCIFLYSQLYSTGWMVFLWVELGLYFFQKRIHKAIVLHKQLKRAKSRRDSEFELYMDHLNDFDRVWTEEVMAHLRTQWLDAFDKRCTLVEEYNEVAHKYNDLVRRLGVQEMDIADSVGD